MKFYLRKFVGWLLATYFILSGTRAKMLRIYQQKGAILSVFTHHPLPTVFEEVLKWITQKGFRFISTDELLAIRDGKKEWSPNLAWLTFDDGWEGFEQHILPILECYHVPATIFVAPNETKRGVIWTNSLTGIADERTIDSLYNESAENRYRQVDKLLEGIKPAQMLASQDELQRLATNSLITLENHTWSHLSCGNRPVEEVVNEVVKTQEILTEWTGRVPRLLCYPFGHYVHAVDDAVTALNLLPIHSNPGVMTLNSIGNYRNMIHETMSLRENIGRVLGAWKLVNVRKF